MSLIDDARRVLMGNVSVHLVHDPDHGATYICLHCPTRVLYSSGESFVHAAECPVFSMPKIVAALEASERAVDGIDPDVHRLGTTVSETVDRLIDLRESLDS